MLEKPHWMTCRKKDCDECQALIDCGILMACDECDMVGHTESDGWTLLEDGRVLCQSCYKKEFGAEAVDRQA